MKLKHIAISLMSAAVIAACSSPGVNTTSNNTLSKAMTKSALVSGIDTSGFNTDVRVQDDFYEHVNGTWLKNTEIPSDKSNYSLFGKLADEAEVNVRSIIDEVSNDKSAKAGSAAQKVRDYYNTYNTQADSESTRVDALKAELKQIAMIETLDDVYKAFGELGKTGTNSPIGGGIFSDAKDPNTNIVYIGQAGLTLPDRDYYLKDDENFVKGRTLFKSYVEEIFALAGLSNGSQAALDILALEKQIAAAQWTKEDNRNPNKTYNPVDNAGLKALTDKINWDTVITSSGIPLRDKYVVQQPTFFTELGNIMTSTPISTWQDYLRFHTLDSFTSALGKPFAEASFNFYRKGLQGVPERPPLWKRSVRATQGALGEVIGQLYVEKHFQPEAKERMVTMVDNLKKAYAASIKDLDWMSEETKKKALVKLAGFRTKIGYPDKWRDYSKLKIGTDLVQNVRNTRLFELQRQLNKLDKPVDKDEWFMTPQTVNAYYNPIWNEIVFPAAILQPPFFNVNAEDAVNYGGIGAVIGHEIGHGFDDSGRKYDGDGNLRDWWTEADAEKFEVRKNKLAAQYDGYEALPGVFVNGQFTSGENIGDLGGLSIAYKAYQMATQGKDRAVIDGMTADQRVFYGWGQVWRRLYRDEELKRRITTDPHSPAKFRGNGAVVNIPEFYQAFDVNEGDKMYLSPEERVRIW